MKKEWEMSGKCLNEGPNGLLLLSLLLRLLRRGALLCEPSWGCFLRGYLGSWILGAPSGRGNVNKLLTTSTLTGTNADGVLCACCGRSSRATLLL